MFKKIFNFFADIVKQVLIKVITFLLIIAAILLALRIFLGINVLDLLF